MSTEATTPVAVPLDGAVRPGAEAWIWQHDETGRIGFVDQWQVDRGWQEQNPRLKLIAPLYRMSAAADVVGAMWDEYKQERPSYRSSYEEGYLDALDAAERRLRKA